MLSLNVFAYILFILASFVAMVLIYNPIANKCMQTAETKFYMLPFNYILIFYALSSLVIYFGFKHSDFIQPLTATRAFVPLVLATIIFISSLFLSKVLQSLIVFACVALTVWMQPLGEGFPFQEIPTWLSKITLIVFFSVFCIFFSIMNSLPHIMIIPSVIILLAVSLLSALSAAPIYLALSSAVLIGALCGYLSVNLNMVKIPFNNESCSALAYLIVNILLLDASEFSFSSCLIFTIIFWAEFIIALWNRFVIIKSGSLSENTFYFQAAEKYNMRVLLINISRISVICMFIGWFQLYSVNQYSLIIVCLAIVVWLNYNFVHPTESKSLKQINQSFISDIKQNLSEVTESFSEISSQKNTAKSATKKKSTKSKSPVRKKAK